MQTGEHIADDGIGGGLAMPQTVLPEQNGACILQQAGVADSVDQPDRAVPVSPREERNTGPFMHAIGLEDFDNSASDVTAINPKDQAGRRVGNQNSLPDRPAYPEIIGKGLLQHRSLLRREHQVHVLDRSTRGALAKIVEQGDQVDMRAARRAEHEQLHRVLAGQFLRIDAGQTLGVV